jgi:integrase/recombinase XerD
MLSGFDVIEPFLEMMSVERGASRNTLDAYRRDVAQFSEHLSSHNTTFGTCDALDVESYLALLHQRGIAARSVARKISAIKQLFHFLKGYVRMIQPLRWMRPNNLNPFPRCCVQKM